MKIAILTQPLKSNYGGLLQAFALQTALKIMGHEVLVVDNDFKKLPLIIKVISIIKRSIIRFFGDKNIIMRAWPTVNENNIITANTKSFIKNNIHTTEKIGSVVKYKTIKKYSFDAFIVGSDQIWRPKYSPNLSNYFLDFIKKNDNIKRIAYAASFGVDHWEFSKEQTFRCSELVKQFNAISVREDSAVKFCNRYFDVESTHVLDPTMLLKKEDYIALVERDGLGKSDGTLMTYVLDKIVWKKEIIQQISNELNLKPFSVLPNKTFSEVGRGNIEDCIYPPLTKWIRGFMDADFVVTDSFHGTVFAIIFNKQFICIGNKNRGLTRMVSLLTKVGLMDRLIIEKKECIKLSEYKSIDYEVVNQIIKLEKNKSINFLKNALYN
jgi:hypothetical protein